MEFKLKQKAIKYLKNNNFSSDFWYQKHLLLAYLQQDKYINYELEQLIEQLITYRSVTHYFCYARTINQRELILKNLALLKERYAKSYPGHDSPIDFYVQYVDSHYLRTFLYANFLEQTTDAKLIERLHDYTKFLHSSKLINEIFWESYLTFAAMLVLALLNAVFGAYGLWRLIIAPGTPLFAFVMVGLVLFGGSIILFQVFFEGMKQAGDLARGIENKNKLLKFAHDFETQDAQQLACLKALEMGEFNKQGTCTRIPLGFDVVSHIASFITNEPEKKFPAPSSKTEKQPKRF